MPVLSTKRMPHRHARSSTGGRPESPHIHYRCHRGRCRHPAKFTVIRAGSKAENLCRHHASEVCEENELHLPDMPELAGHARR
jgi:hypothetical protein